MSTSFYVQKYLAATQRYAEIKKDRDWEEWAPELYRIKKEWKWSVKGMLTQLDQDDPELLYALGNAYSSGHGIERSFEQAEELLRRPAQALDSKKSHNPAIYNVPLTETLTPFRIIFSLSNSQDERQIDRFLAASCGYL